MPFTIKKLKMWKDPGYTEECVEVPPIGSWKLPAADWENVHTVEGVTQSYDLRPRKYATLTSIELPIAFSETWDMSYLYMEAEDTAGSIRIFGWIRTVERIAASEEAVRIAWVPDYWRTFSGALTFGRGTVTKTSDSTYKRPLRLQPRKWVVSRRENIDNYSALGRCLIFSYVETVNTDTYIRTGYAPIDNATGLITVGDALCGRLDEYLVGIAPSSILGVWISPIAPGPFEAGWLTGISGHQYYLRPLGIMNSVYVTDLQNEYVSDDTHRAVLTDFYGAIVAEVPWGYSVYKNITLVLEIATDACYVNFTFGNPEEGCKFTLPCLTLPVTTNAWSQYNYSGQREYDKESKRIQRNQKAVTGTLQSATSGTIAGALVGGGNPVTAVAGLVAGVTAGLVDTFTAEMYDDQLQEATDKLYSNQSANLILSGSGAAWDLIGHFRMVQLEADSVSATEISDYIAINGYDVEIPAADCSAFLVSGPVQILNMQVTGEVMPAAKSAIKNKIANGVYIVENNPTGVVP